MIDHEPRNEDRPEPKFAGGEWVRTAFVFAENKSGTVEDIAWNEDMGAYKYYVVFDLGGSQWILESQLVSDE